MTTTLHQNLTKIATSSLVDAMSVIRCGFELETTAFCGEDDDSHCSANQSAYEDDGEEEGYAEFFIDRASHWDNELLELGEDGSVSGPEIRTRGPLTVQKFLKAANILCKNKLEVGTGCSFHIHLSALGVRHQYSQKFQLSLIEGILRQFSQVPECVLQRWASGGLNEYFQTGLEPTKYRFVAHRAEWNTWEFRCWGNINSAKDAAKALMISIRALRFAYRVKLGLETSLLTPELWHNGLNSFMENSFFPDLAKGDATVSELDSIIYNFKRELKAETAERLTEARKNVASF